MDVDADRMEALGLGLELNSLRALLVIEQHRRHLIPLAVQHCVKRRYRPDGGAGRVDVERVVDGTLENVMVAVLLLML